MDNYFRVSEDKQTFAADQMTIFIWKNWKDTGVTSQECLNDVYLVKVFI